MRRAVDVDDPERNWTDAGIYQVAEGVYRIPLPLPDEGLKAVNVYVVRDGTNVTLIDSGQALVRSRELLAAAVGELGVGFSDVSRYLITHYHRDHYTLAVALRREFGRPIGLGEGEAASLAFHRNDTGPARGLQPQVELLAECGADKLASRLLADQQDPAMLSTDDLGADVWEEPDEWLVDGARIEVGARTLTVIATPGHTNGHVVFTEPDRGLLFAGDHVLPTITPSIGLQGAPTRYPLRDYLGSLRRVRALPDARLLPAHGPTTASVYARIHELLDHHDQRFEAVRRAVGPEPTTAFEAASALLWTRRHRTLDELNPFNATLAVLETKAHLDLLVLHGRLATTADHGVCLYTTT